MNLEQDSHVTMKIAQEIHENVERSVQTAILYAGQKNGGSSADCAYVGCMASLGAIMTTGAIFAKTPGWAKEKQDNNPGGITPNETERLASEMMTPETVVFAALAAAYTMRSLSEKGLLDTSFGPPVLWQALEAWTKLFPGLKADNYFDPKMLEAARKAGSEVEKPFADFLQGRITHKNSPGTLN